MLEVVKTVFDFYGMDPAQHSVFKRARDMNIVATVTSAEASIISAIRMLTSKNISSVKTIITKHQKKILSADGKADDIQPGIYKPGDAACQEDVAALESAQSLKDFFSLRFFHARRRRRGVS